MQCFPALAKPVQQNAGIKAHLVVNGVELGEQDAVDAVRVGPCTHAVESITVRLAACMLGSHWRRRDAPVRDAALRGAAGYVDARDCKCQES